MSAREDMLAQMRRALGRGVLDEAKKAELEARLAAHPRNLVPKRAQLDHPAQVELFIEMAERAAATTVRVASLAEVPTAVAEFLAAQNLPAAIRLAPDPGLQAMPWRDRPLLKVETGIAQPGDRASVSPAFAGVAETGTLMMVSGPTSPTTLNFLPENHIVVLRADQIVGPFEDAWDRLRAARRGADFPRAINFITGPSRSADIEQQLVMGAHGPRRLHIILVAEDSNAQAKA
ncbi:MAG TPA: lactate utilization protein [Alphaproteobacteria bacterium]|nr:lactate utilization protein [Alphaproteobacteria bacterium]